ncbi:MAG: hypothetical protein SGCHY_002238 [Lobulomycetales sp.]
MLSSSTGPGLETLAQLQRSNKLLTLLLSHPSPEEERLTLLSQMWMSAGRDALLALQPLIGPRALPQSRPHHKTQDRTSHFSQLSADPCPPSPSWSSRKSLFFCKAFYDALQKDSHSDLDSLVDALESAGPHDCFSLTSDHSSSALDLQPSSHDFHQQPSSQSHDFHQQHCDPVNCPQEEQEQEEQTFTRNSGERLLTAAELCTALGIDISAFGDWDPETECFL